VARKEPIWVRLGHRSQYAYRRATGRYTPGTTGAERGRRRRRAEQERAFAAALRPPARPSWQPIPGGRGRAVSSGDPATVLEALREAQREGRQTYIILQADAVLRGYGSKHPEGRAFLGSVPPGVLVALAESRGGDVFSALEDLARRQGTEVEGINEVQISSYPR
jgi:hypothetical protein